MIQNIPEETWLEWIDRLSAQHYVVINDFISEELYGEIRAYFKELLVQDEFSKAGIGVSKDYQINKNIRGDQVYWLERTRDTNLHEFFELMDEWIARLNRYCYLSISGSEFHLAYYPPGSFYKKHLDQFREQSNRLISVILYLNEAWQKGDGGELKIYLDEGKEKLVEPIGKRLVLFRSDTIAHEVLTTQKGRYSLTGWLLYQPAGLGFLTS